MLVSVYLVGVRLGKAGFWREIEGGWQFSFEIQVETREKIVPPENSMKRFSSFSSSRVAVTFACTSMVAMVSQLQAAVVTSGLRVAEDAANS